MKVKLVLLAEAFSVPVCGTGASTGIGPKVFLSLRGFCLTDWANAAIAATAKSTSNGRNMRKRVVVVIGGKLLSGALDCKVTETNRTACSVDEA
jgi:hypothetical protein